MRQTRRQWHQSWHVSPRWWTMVQLGRQSWKRGCPRQANELERAKWKGFEEWWAILNKTEKMEILNYTDGTVFSSKRWYHKMNFKASTRPLEKLHRKRNNKPWHLAPSSIQQFKIKRGDNGVKVAWNQISWTFLDQTENLVKPYTQLQV